MKTIAISLPSSLTGNARHHRRLPATLLIALAAGCASHTEGPTTPRAGSIRVSVQTSGGLPNDDKLEVVVGSDVRRLVTAQSELVISDLSAGNYTVELDGVAVNCTSSGPPTRAVAVPAGGMVDVPFSIDCAATGFQITTRTTGYDNPFGYQVLVNGQLSLNGHVLGDVEPNSSQVISRVPPGTYAVSLQMPGDHCIVPGGQPITVEVPNRQLTPIRFEIACVPPLRPEKIAYVVDDPTAPWQSWIALANPDGSGAADLAVGRFPAWSPDGTRLVFTTRECDFDDGCTDGSLVLMDPDVGRFIPLSSGSSGSRPAWAPSGDRIAFVDGRLRLFVTALDGSPPVEVEVPGASVMNNPAWSPDGRKIACLCLDASSVYNVCVINNDGTGLMRLTGDDVLVDRPAWSPDGRRIAFTIATGRLPSQVAVMAADGSGVTRLTDGFDAAWSHDGTKLIFARADGLFAMDADGSNVKLLTTGSDHAPAWRP